MNILFLFKSPLEGDALEQGPLGGTETALIGVSRELAKLPETQVYVCADTQFPGVHTGVHYIPLTGLAEWSRQTEIDVFICIRQWLPLWLPIKARRRIFFSPDAWTQPSLRSALNVTLRLRGEIVDAPILLPEEFFPTIDEFFCVGTWQANTFVSELGFPEEKIFITGNAIFPENFEPAPLDQRRPVIMYSATPFRGLEYLIDYYMELKNSHPALTLEVCSGMGVYGHSKEQDQAGYGSLYQKLDTVGAISHGSIQQKKLARIMCTSRVYTYPNTFPETFCISVLEAQAAGLPVVTSRLGALTERITHGVDGFLIEGQPSDETYKRKFLEITRRLLTDDDLWQRISSSAQKRAQQQSYDRLACIWRQRFENVLSEGKARTVPEIPDLRDRNITLPDGSGQSIKIPASHISNCLQQSASEFGFT